jgi:hypothetical protein
MCPVYVKTGLVSIALERGEQLKISVGLCTVFFFSVLFLRFISVDSLKVYVFVLPNDALRMSGGNPI